MNTNQTNPQDGVIETSIRAWINANTTATRFTSRDLCRISRTVDDALGLGMKGGIARRAIRNFVARVLSQREQLHA